MALYVYPSNVETEISGAYIGIPYPESISLDKSSINLTTIGQTAQLTATIEPTPSDTTITWASSNTTIATVSSSGLVTCVTPGTCTITAITANGLTASCSVAQGGLPSTYQEVEYIESSGTQYFVVGSSFKTSYKSVIDLQMTVVGGDYIPLGVFNNEGQRYGIDARGGNFTVITGGGNWNNTISEDTNRHLFTIDKSTVTVDGTSYSSQYSSYTFNKGVGVFGYHNTQNGSVGFLASAKLYKLDIYDENGTQIYDLVPCYRKLDSVIGMYDIINDVFYTNEGTGTFTKGNDV